jgi:hypothetical protein
MAQSKTFVDPCWSASMPTKKLFLLEQSTRQNAWPVFDSVPL